MKLFPKKLSDQMIVEGLRSKDRRVVNEMLKYIYRTSWPFAKAIVVNSGGDSDSAADVFQEALIILHNQVKAGKFEARAPIHIYLKTIVRNLWYNQQRKKKPVQLDDVMLLSLTENESSVELYEVIRDHRPAIRVIDFIEQLDSGCKEIIDDFYFEKLSFKEIADKHNFTNVASAKNKKYRCLKKVLDMLNARGVTRDKFEF